MTTYGTIRHDTFRRPGKADRPVWVVQATPHVSRQLKRWFGRVEKGSGGEVVIGDTPEVARDLLWLTDRYPMDVPDLARLAARAEEHRERERAVGRILSGSFPPGDVELALPLREYQRQAVAMTHATGSLLLADDVGLGKTACGIGLLADPRCRPGLVVTMTHLPRQWEAELRKFAPNLRVYVARSGKAEEFERVMARSGLFPPEVLILNYHKLVGWSDHLAGFVRGVVFDECQELRHSDSQKYRAARSIAARASFRLGLSATPIYNYGGEFHNVLEVIRPDALGSREEFVREWCGGSYVDKPRIKNPAAFGSYLRAEGLMLRRTRSEVARELPPLTKVRHEVDADTAALDEVEGRAAELARVILAQGGEGVKGERMRASEELSWRLRQATGIGKARNVADFVRLLVEGGERVLLFGWHHEVYGLWREHLADLNPAFYTGSETIPQKLEAVRRFTEGETPVLVMSLRAGAGVDGLQGSCRTVVFGEIDWSPAIHEQCVGRLHRDGQSDPVVAYFLVSESGSDPVVADVLGLKREQIEGVRDPGAELVERLEVDGNHIKRLAAEYLARKGKPAPVASGV